MVRRAEHPSQDAPDSKPLPLSPQDRAILELEGPTIAGHTCKVIRIADPGASIDQLRRHVAARLGTEPLLRCRLGETAEGPAWVTYPDFDIVEQLVDTGLDGLAAAELERLVAELFEQHLDRELPLWRIDVAGLQGGGTALIWRLHHSLADGTAAMRIARSVLWDSGSPPPAGGARPAPDRGADDRRRLGHLAAFIGRELADTIRDSPFDGEVGTKRAVALASVPLGELHDAAKRQGATVNDAVLAAVGGGLRRWLSHHHGPLGSLRLRVPVSLHHEGDDAANRDSFFTVPVPITESDPVARLRAVREGTAERKAAHDAELLARLRSRSPALAALADRLERSPRSFALCVSNVPGPRAPVTVCGAPVAELHSIAEIGRRHALRIAVVSIADDLCFGFCADPLIAGDLREMAAGTEAEAGALIAAG